MWSRLIAMRTEFLDFKSFCCVSSVLFCGVPRYTWRTLGWIGPALATLKGNYDSDALVFGHKDVMSLLRYLLETKILQAKVIFLKKYFETVGSLHNQKSK